MQELKNKQVLVIGLGLSGRAACRLLARRGARVTAVDAADTESLRRDAGSLRKEGVTVRLGARSPGTAPFDLAVISPGVPGSSPLVARLASKVPVISELELGYQQSLCMNVSVTGTNGKTTTTELIEAMLTQAQRRTIAAGNIGRPLCEVVDETRDLDYLTLEVSSFQLEYTAYFRPTVAVLLNLAGDHFDRYAGMDEYARAKGRLFMNQQQFDWAIVQSEALAHLRSLEVPVPAKVITFSAANRRADLFYDRGLLVSRLEGWSGPLLNLEDCRLRGPHNAENMMAALAVGRVLRLPLESMRETLKGYSPAPHRFEEIAECDGVVFINDSKSTNVDSLQKALQSVPGGRQGGEPNVWLIAGGIDKGLEYHDVGPLIAQRVRGVFLMGEARDKLRAAWSLFAPCVQVDSLEEAVRKAAGEAVAGDCVLLSPACSSFDQFQDYRHRGTVFREAVEQWVDDRRPKRPANRGALPATRNTKGAA